MSNEITVNLHYPPEDVPPAKKWVLAFAKTERWSNWENAYYDNGEWHFYYYTIDPRESASVLAWTELPEVVRHG